jgi:hypothetical protein
MHPELGLSGALTVQAAFPLCPSIALAGLLLVGGGAQSRQRNAEGVAAVLACKVALLDNPTDEPVGTMGRPRGLRELVKVTLPTLPHRQMGCCTSAGMAH